MLVLYHIRKLLEQIEIQVPPGGGGGGGGGGGAGPKWLDHMPVKGWVTQQAWPVRFWTLTGKFFINWST